MGEPERPIISVLGEAVEYRSPEERAAFLDKACAGDPDRRARVEELLRAHQAAGNFLQGNRRPSEDGAASDEPITERPGTLVGGYKLLEQIGEGGFGVVFMAEQQQPIRRKVALKVLKPGMDTRQVVARFEAERQALALMDHPNIAHVFDGGATASRRPYFVMELVRGVPVTDFCDQNRLCVRERLVLFADVCKAVQHAHQKGVIHRDIKPSNVLVTLQDGRALVKVIDFGIAKATGQQLTDKTLFTNFAQMIGTPLYMSPEQTQMTSVDVDTRSDIYSLGVLLYEMLTGTTPFDKERLRSVGYDEMHRILRDEDPPMPSTRLSTLGAASATASDQRSTDPGRLCRLLRGDLDWIVMKCLEKDRQRRYETTDALARDLERHLHDEPVEARPPSAAYRLHKFARRHFMALGMAAALTVGVLLALAALAISNVRVGQQQEETARALAAALAAKEELANAVVRERRSLYEARVALARSHYLAGDADQAKEQLLGCPVELRDRQWHLVHRQCHAELLRIRANSSGVLRARYSPDGRLIATVNSATSTDPKSTDKAQLWDAETGKLRFACDGHSSAIQDAAFSHNGKQLITVASQLVPNMPIKNYERTEIKRWDVARGTVIGDVTLPARYAPARLSADSRLLFAYSYLLRERLDVYETATGQPVALLNAPQGQRWFQARHVSADGAVFASDDQLGNLRIWDTRTGKVVRTLPSFRGMVDNEAVSDDGKQIVMTRIHPGGAMGEIKVFDMATGAVIVAMRAHANLVGRPAFSPDGRRLAWVESDNIVVVADIADAREAFAFRSHSQRITHLVFRPDGHRLASSAWDGTLRVWDVSPLPGE
jgi:Tol biopolymer transport system component